MGEWYRSFYMQTDKDEAALREAVKDPENMKDIRKRLHEFRALPRSRCVISDQQADFLEKIIRETPNGK